MALDGIQPYSIKPISNFNRHPSTLTALTQRSSSLFAQSNLKHRSFFAGSSGRIVTAAMTNHFKYVFLGGGNSGGYAAKQFIELGGSGADLALITDESVVSYERPALSKAYLFPESPARLPGFHTCVGGGGERQDAAWYADKGISFLTDTKITAADVAAKKLTTSTGNEITYEKLIIGTGARPVSLADFKTPGADLKGIFYLRNVKDGDALVAAIAATKAAGGKAVCIGGGYIGMECAAALAMNGLDVTMVYPEPHLMQRLLTPELASFYEKFYAAKGITMIKGALAQGFRGDEATGTTVTHTLLKGGVEVESSLVIVGVGARPNVELFKGQLELLEGPPGGIKVDSQLRASVPDVWAVGDVAAFPLQDGDSHSRQEHVQNARQSAAHAVKDMMMDSSGAPGAAYDYLPFFYSRIFNLSWQFYGLARGEVVHFGDHAEGKFGAFWVDGGRILGAFLESGSPEEFAALKKVATEQPEAPSDLREQGLSFLSKL